MNMGLKIFLLYWIMIGCASTPKPAAKKKVGTTAPAGKAVKGTAAKPVAGKPAATKAVTPPPPVEEEEVHEEEEDDQFSRIKKYYKK